MAKADIAVLGKQAPKADDAMMGILKGQIAEVERVM
jgi:hypothetical protein